MPNRRTFLSQLAGLGLVPGLRLPLGFYLPMAGKLARPSAAESLAASCAARGLGLGVYLSPRDDSLGAGLSGVCATPEAQGRYNGIYRQQLTELLTRYGNIVELWLDGSSVVPTGDLVAQHAPR